MQQHPAHRLGDGLLHIRRGIGKAGGEQFLVRKDGRAGQHVHIAGKTGGGLIDLAGTQVKFHQKAVAHIRQAEGFSHGLVGPAGFERFLRVGLDTGVQQGGHTGFDLDHRFIELCLGQLEGFLRLVFFQAKLDPDSGGVSGVGGQLVQQRFSLAGVAAGGCQACQLDGGRLPIGRAAGAADLLQQGALALPPAVVGVFVRCEEKHFKSIVYRSRIELQRGAAGPAVEQRIQLYFRPRGVALHDSFHHFVDPGDDLLIGQRFFKLQQGIHIGAQGSCQRAEQGDIRVGAVCFPFADGRSRDAQLCGQLFLCKSLGFAQSGNVRADLFLCRFHGFVPAFLFQRRGFAVALL